MHLFQASNHLGMSDFLPATYDTDLLLSRGCSAMSYSSAEMMTHLRGSIPVDDGICLAGTVPWRACWVDIIRFGGDDVFPHCFQPRDIGARWR